MSIKYIMNKNVHMISSDISSRDAARIMSEKNIGVILVGNPEHIEGIFSERDLMSKVISKSIIPSDIRVKDVMTTNVSTISENEDSEYALALMVKRGIRHLPVVNDKNICIGMLSSRDLMKEMVEILENENNSLLEYLMAVEKVKDIIYKHKNRKIPV